MTGRKLKPGETRAWAGVAKTVRRHSETTPPELPDLSELDKLISAEQAQSASTKPVSGPLRHPLAIFAAEAPKPLRPPVSHGPADRGGERKVRRGQMPITGTLDLHGHTQTSAQTAFFRFLRHHQAARSTCVLVITGKGKRGEGVLRQRFLQWLKRDDVRSLVSSYAGAHQKHGGSGAFYVFLRKKP